MADSGTGVTRSKASSLIAARLKKARARLEQDREPEGRRAGGTIPARSPGTVAPLSLAQERLWFLERLAPGTAQFNICRAVALHFAPGHSLSPLWVRRLGEALTAVMARHEALRFTFHQEGEGEPRQCPQPVAAFSEPRLPRIDLTALAPTTAARLAAALARREAATPVDLGTGPPWRARLLLLPPGVPPVLLLTFHHLVFDGWSLGVFLDEVSRFWAATPVEALSVAAPPVQYGDFAAWERQRLAATPPTAALEYWRGQLTDLDPLALLGDRSWRGSRAGQSAGHPPGHPTGHPMGHRAGVLPWRLPRELSQALDDRARAAQASLFMVLLAAWAGVVGRWAGGLRPLDRVAVGTPVARRDRRELEGVVGFFVNTLALVVPLEGDPTLEALVGRARRVVLEGTAHGDLPFARVVQEVAPDRSGGSPLYRVTLAFQNTPGGRLRLPGVERAAVHFVDRAVTDQDLILSVEESAEGATAGARTGTVVFNRDLFDPTTVRRFLERFERLLRAVAWHPEARLGGVDLLPPAERHQLLVEGNAPAAPALRSPTNAWELFGHQAETQPEALAVVAAGATLSYGALAARAGRLAERLRQAGAGPETIIAVVLPRSPELVTAILGTVATGAAYLPLDARHPVERLHFMAVDAGVTAVIAEAALGAALTAVSAVEGPSENLSILSWEALEDSLEQEAAAPAPAPAPSVGPDHLAYLIYTSGSTGRPKGTLLRHGGLVNLVRWHHRQHGLGPGDRATLLAGTGFDASVWELWSCLGNGATLHIPPTAVIADPAALVGWLATKGITHTFLPTPLAEAVLDLELPPTLALRVLATGGDRLHHYPNRPLPFRLANHYGPTENTVVATWGAVPPRPGADTAPTIGGPMAGVRAYCLNAGLDPVPVGVPGELCLAGTGLARGYHRRPALTAAAFVPDPFATVDAPGGRLYRTGDLARWLPGGEIDFLGRRDGQVKVRGFRIELGEIESRLAALPGVAAAAVLALPSGTGDPRLVAYLATSDAATVPPWTPETLRRELAKDLPDYMVPTAWAFLETLPVNTSGKVDRKALAKIEPEGHGEAGWVAPRTALEEVVAEAFRSVLGGTLEVTSGGMVGAHDDFFALGGHSLLAPRLVARLAQTTGVELPLEAVFAGPTVAALAARLAGRDGDGADTAPPPLVPWRGEGDPPLSFAQQRLWLVDRMDPGSPAYNVPTAVDFDGPLEPRRLAKALGRIVARQGALRTTFPSVGGEPVQRVAPAEAGQMGSLPLPVIDLGALPEAVGAREGERWLIAAARRPFALETGPLARYRLLRWGPERHTLLVAMHHIITDGWSVGVFLQELEAFYRGASLPPLAVQYGDFAHWQRQGLEGATLERLVAAESQRLGALPVLELPTDRSRPAVRDTAGDRLPVQLPAALTERLKALGAAHGLTLFMTLLATFQAFLHRLTGETDLAVGTPVAGRGQGAVEGLMGFFINTVVMRTALHGDPVFPELAARVRAGALSAYAHAEVPFEKLVEALAPERNLAHTPLFQVMLILQNAPLTPPRLPGIEARLRPIEAGISKFDLTLALGEGLTDGADGADSGCLRGYWIYATHLFDRSTVQRLARGWQTLLEGLVAGPRAEDARPLSHLPLLTAAERHQILVEWTAPQVDYGDAPPVHRQVAAQAARAPGAVALRSAGESLTYGALMVRSGALAARLRHRGVGPEVRVALYFERGFDMVVAVVAVLRAGGAYVPLDPANPTERTAFILADTEARLLLTHPPRAERAAELVAAAPVPVEVLEVGGEAEVGGEMGTTGEPPDGMVHPESAAYVIYTSGSTGRPKGVVVSHRSLASRLRYAALVDFTAADAFLQKTTLAFDVSILEIFGPLVVGGRVILARPGGEKDAAYLVDLMAAEGVTQASFPPTLLETLFLQPGFGALTGLRTVITGGETVPVDLPGRFHRALPHLGVDLLNRYGPTETTISVTSWRCRRQAKERTLPIGRPTAKTRAYVLDRYQQPVLAGAIGELCLGGPGVARGYLGRPRRTAGSFLPDPFGAEPGARLYRSGDLVRHRVDGALEFIGRVDRQVKVRGFRVELGEIEAALRALPGVAEVAVVDFEDGGSRRLAAYWVAAAESIDSGALQAAAGERLPGYMVPEAFMALPRLPLSPTGKIDRRALPRPRWGRGEEGVGGAPASPLEQRVAAIWEALLQRQEGAIGREDDFFALGGHSLLAVQLLSRLREGLGVDLPLRTLFEAPTVAALAAVVERASARGQTAEVAVAPTLAPEGWEKGDLPSPSFAQERLWFLEQLHPGNATYHVHRALRLRGPLDEAALERALAAVVERQEALRLVFDPQGGRPRLRVLATAALPLPLLPRVELPVADSTAVTREEQHLLRREALSPFDLERGPLFRFRLLRRGGGHDERLLVLNFHHAVFDGWSMGVFLRELATFYGAFSTGAEARLPDLPISYRQAVHEQRRAAESGLWEEDLAYWRQHLEGAPERLELWADHPATEGFPGRTLPVALPAAVGRQLDALAQREGVTPFMVLLAAYSALLARFSGQGETVVGIPTAGRDRREVEGLIGYFINALPLRLAPVAAGTFRALVHQAREVALGGFAHQGFPFERLVAALEPERSLTESPLFQVMFSLHTQAMALPDLPGVTVTLEALPAERARLALSLVLRPGDGDGDAGYRGTLEYRRDLFEAATAERLMGAFQRLLAAALAAPEAPLASLPVLSEAERGQILEGWGRGAVPSGVEALLPVHAAVLRQIRERPEAPALCWSDGDRDSEAKGDTVWSYRTLGEVAGRFGAALQARDVGRGDVVAVRLQRSPREVAALLAILSTGAAYLPLDPEWPEERTNFVLEDARPRCLVTAAELPGLARGGGAAVDTVLLDALEGVAPGAGIGADWTTTADSGELAYVIYTSGSTGRPKGVAVTHGGLANLMRWHTATLGQGPEDRATRLSGLAFDAAVCELWPYLVAGASLVMPRDPEIRLSPSRLRDWLVGQRVTHAFVPTPLAEALFDEVWPEETALAKLHTGGDKLHRYPPVDFPARVFNHYGPTEATVQATWATVEPLSKSAAPERAPTLGGPIGGVRVHVVDSLLQPVPPGVAGELLIGGAGVARGYRDRPALTAAAFVPDPFSAVPGARLYRTGDRVRWLAARGVAGEIEFLGRLDRQVKIRGFRIELGEIETALATHPAVRHGAVVVAGEGAGRRLVAYVEWAPGATVKATVEDVLAALRRRLPEAMVPATLVEVAAMPLTSSGKIDRRRLPEPEARDPRHAVAVAPRNPVEARLLALWRAVLKVETLGVEDDFFAAGGHSLLAAQVIAGVEAEFGQRLPLAALFEGRTVARLAALVREERAQVELLVPLRAPRTDATAPPLFLVHPVGGTVYAYGELVAALGQGPPVFAFQAPGVEGEEAPMDDLEAMARRYRREARRVQPSGPLHLGGWSLGGVVAFEMARQEVAEQGEEAVGPLLLIDSWLMDAADSAAGSSKSVESGESGASGENVLLARFTRHLELPAEAVEAVGAVVRGERPEASVADRLPEGLDLPTLFRVFRAHGHALAEYSRRVASMEPYPGVVHLFEATERPATVRGSAAALWRPRVATGQLLVETIPGNHFTLLRGESARTLARRVRRMQQGVESV